MLTSKNQSYTYLNIIENLLKQNLKIKFINQNGELVGINKQSHRFEFFNRADVRLDNYIGLIKISKSDVSKCGNPQMLKNLYLEEMSHINTVILQETPPESALLDLVKYNWLSFEEIQDTFGNLIENDNRYLTLKAHEMQIRMQTMTEEVKQLNKVVKKFDILSDIVLGNKKESEI